MTVLMLNRCLRQKINDSEDLTVVLAKKESRLSRRDAASIGKYLPTFRRGSLPPSSVPSVIKDEFPIFLGYMYPEAGGCEFFQSVDNCNNKNEVMSKKT